MFSLPRRRIIYIYEYILYYTLAACALGCADEGGSLAAGRGEVVAGVWSNGDKGGRVCVCVCVCVRERDRQGDKEKERWSERATYKNRGRRRPVPAIICRWKSK